MSQKTNLNINPYYDDFDSEKNFLRVLFKPGYPVQSRELTTLQSILQNQVEEFGSYMFKEGSMVIPGNVSYDGQFYAVKLNSTQFGIDLSLYIDKFVGKTVKGSVSEVTAKIQKVVLPSENGNVDNVTLYVKYLESDSNFEFSEFLDGESLSATENIVYGNTTINAETPFGSLIDTDATAIGSAASVADGVYFIRGHFVNVSEQSILLDEYTNTPSYRVGLEINESIVVAKEDASLYDNAKGFTNYSAPGADRLKISLTLTKRSLDDTKDTNFVELLRLKDGKVKKVTTKTDNNIIRDYLAERTFDESGNYTVIPFDLNLEESLNNRLGNDGSFFSNEKTEQGNTPSDDLVSLKLSPGKAYVKGYDIEKVATTIVDVEKPRDTDKIENATVPFEMGNILKVNNVTGLAKVRETISLYSQFGCLGEEIGKARVYSFNLTDSQYTNASTSWDLRLYDIQTYTRITVNKELTASEFKQSYFVKGKSSGATGFATADGSNQLGSTGAYEFFLRQTSGSFSVGEQLIINGVETSTSVRLVRAYNTQNIKSVKQLAPFGGSNFEADSILDKFDFPGGVSQLSITAESGGISTVTSPGKIFVGVRTDTVVRYQKSGSSLESYNRISAISSDALSFEISGITTVTGVFDGALPTSDIQVNGFLGAPVIKGSGTLFASLPEINASDIDLSSSNIYLIDQLTGQNVGAGNSITINTSAIGGITDISWVNFDQERFTVGYNGGGIGTITSDSFNLSGNNLTILNLDSSQSSGDTVVNVTFLKNKIQSKIKNYSRSRVLFVSGSKLKESGSGIATSKNDGLSYVEYYGLRVQDEEISLNYPDVVKVLSVYESLDSSNPTLDTVQFPVIANVGQNALIGENIIGNVSNAVARVVSNNTTDPSTGSANKLGIVYLNGNEFSIGESVTFQESGIKTEIDSITNGNYNDVTNSFKLNRGQKNQYYDYSSLVRTKNTQEPSRRLMVIFDHYTIPSDDTGDVFTINSYDEERFSTDIPNIGGSIRATDTLDFRPRVDVFDASSATASPFDFNSRTSAFNTSPLRLLAPEEGSTVSQSFYLPRMDKIYLNILGDFIVDKGVSSKDPKPPTRKGEFLELGTILYPAYLYNPADAGIILTDNRRYTMRDIGIIEDRVENLEKQTSLSLLELSTQSLQIQDAEGRDRFKSGFFVDDFSTDSNFDKVLSTTEVDIESGILNPEISSDSLEPLIATLENLSPKTLDLSNDKYSTPALQLLDSNIQKTGNALTLAYKQVDWLEQPFATKVENVNPFNIVVYAGTVTLDPEVDSWTRTVQLDDKTKKLDRIKQKVKLNIDLSDKVKNTFRVSKFEDYKKGFTYDSKKNVRRGALRIAQKTDFRFQATDTASGSFDTVDTTIRNEVVGTPDEEFMRSRNVEFNASNLKPNTRYYQFLDGKSGVDLVPKLLEISNNQQLTGNGASAAFKVGETVVGTVKGTEKIRFRVCTPNHKTGSFNSPTTTYSQDPYTKSTIDKSYSSTSKILNVDIAALKQAAQGDYFGYVEIGMQLVGQDSGAIAFVKDVKLISDIFGDLNGTFFIKDPLQSPTPDVRIRTGTKTYKLTSSVTNDAGLPGSNSVSFAETNYSATATLLQFQATITKQTTRTTIKQSVSLDLERKTIVKEKKKKAEYKDPLAQTFTVGGNIQVKSDIDTDDDVNGVFLTSVDLFFASIDSGNAPLTVQVRTTQLGTPTLTVIGKEVTLRPRTTDSEGNKVELIKTSKTGEVATNVRFPEPIYLAPGKEYAIVLISDQSDEYEVWTAVMGNQTVNTTELPDVDQVIYTKQFALGTLFKSQNGSVWTTDQNQDLKFKLYKAEFTSDTGTAYFYNPPLDRSNGYIPKLINNPVAILPKKGKIGITTSFDNNFIGIVTAGRRLAGVNNNGGSAIIVGQGSSVSAMSSVIDTLGISDGGENYPASVTNEVVDTFNIIGEGENLKLLITTDANGVITNVTHSTVDYGTGYTVGDVVGIVTSSTSTGTGRDARFTIAEISGVDTLYLTDVQGEFGASGSGKEFEDGKSIQYYDDTNTIVSAAGTNITSAFASGGIYSGDYLRVDHFNHGMYSTSNKVVVDNIKSDIPTTTLSSQVTASESSTISVASTSNFTTFEGRPVTGINTGYVKIGNEIIAYDSVGNGSLSIAASGRAIDETISINHVTGAAVEKYEVGGVSLRRINGVETNVVEPITIDSYHIRINKTNGGTNRSADGILSGSPELSFNDERLTGGKEVTASENILFSQITPKYDIITPGTTTSATAQIRTISATSVDGTESSFNDVGYEDIQLNSLNSLSSLRMVASEANQNAYLTALPRNKSLTTAITFNSKDPNKVLSPILDLSEATTIFNVNRLNQPISDYPNDNRVNSILNDPHASVYYSNIFNLENPASGLKVIVAADRPGDSDFRVLYTTKKADSSEIQQSYELFPGYDNLKETTEGLLVIDPAKNSGLPDTKVRESVDNEFLEYEFTIENLDLFTGYGIKIVMSSSNQVRAPRLQDLRIVALR